MRWRGLSLAVCLGLFWLALSGHFTPLLLAVGAASVLASVLMARRARIVDAEGHPIEMIPRAITYYPWLAGEILKSAWSVTKIILSPSLPVTPTMTVVKAGQKSKVGAAVYANSITLTPGTITVGVHGGEFTVHALVREGALELESGGMDRRVTQFEGKR